MIYNTIASYFKDKKPHKSIILEMSKGGLLTYKLIDKINIANRCKNVCVRQIDIENV